MWNCSDSLIEACDQVVGAKDDEYGRHDQAGDEVRCVYLVTRRCGNGTRDFVEAEVEYIPPNCILLCSSYDILVSKRGAKITNKIHHAGANKIHDRAGSV